MFQFLRNLNLPKLADDDDPAIIAWEGSIDIELSDLANIAERLQAESGLVPATENLGTAISVYADQEEYFKLWIEDGKNISNYLKNNEYRQLPFIPKKCCMMQICSYHRGNPPPYDHENYRKRDPVSTEHLWDAIIHEVQSKANGLFIASEEGIRDIGCKLLVDWYDKSGRITNG